MGQTSSINEGAFGFVVVRGRDADCTGAFELLVATWAGAVHAV